MGLGLRYKNEEQIFQEQEPCSLIVRIFGHELAERVESILVQLFRVSYEFGYSFH